MPCLFCQQDFTESPSAHERTREHIFGDWTTPYLKSPVGPGTQVRWQAKGDERHQNSYPAFPAQQTVQGVCKACNSGWLSEIQTAAKPFLLPALKSTRRRSIGEEAQKALGVWAFRAALLAGAKAGAAAIPPVACTTSMCSESRQAQPEYGSLRPESGSSPTSTTLSSKFSPKTASRQSGQTHSQASSALVIWRFASFAGPTPSPVVRCGASTRASLRPPFPFCRCAGQFSGHRVKSSLGWASTNSPGPLVSQRNRA